MDIPDKHPERPSKSQLKRDARALFDLGRELVELAPQFANSLPLDDRLRDEIETARGMRAHVARKRQLQFIAKLLRSRDTAPLVEAMEAIHQDSRRHVTAHHRVEAWRDRLLAEGDECVTRLVAAREGTDAQPLRQLLRNARREAEQGKPPAAARKLFRLLREWDTVSPLPPAQDSD